MAPKTKAIKKVAAATVKRAPPQNEEKRPKPQAEEGPTKKIKININGFMLGLFDASIWSKVPEVSHKMNSVLDCLTNIRPQLLTALLQGCGLNPYVHRSPKLRKQLVREGTLPKFEVPTRWYQLCLSIQKLPLEEKLELIHKLPVYVFDCADMHGVNDFIHSLEDKGPYLKMLFYS